MKTFRWCQREEKPNDVLPIQLLLLSRSNILKLTDYSSKTPPSTITLALEDLRILSNEVKYQTIYEYVNGINIT